MTDNLRDRIAEVLLEDWPAPVFSTGKQMAQAQKLADKVISALGAHNGDFRDRIAEVLDAHYPQTTGYQDELTDWCQCGLRRDHVAGETMSRHHSLMVCGIVYGPARNYS